MVEYIYAGSVMLILFIILLVIEKKNKNISDYIFVTWLAVFLLNITTFFIVRNNIYPDNIGAKLLVEFSEASVFLHGPLFFLYTVSLTTASFRITPKKILHFVPFLAGFFILLAGLIYRNGITQQLRQIITVIKMVSLLIYVIGILKQLHSHKKKVENIFSNTEDKLLKWINFLAWGILIVWTISITGLLVYNIRNENFIHYGTLVENLTLCLFIFLLGYFGVKQETIYYRPGNIALPDKIFPATLGKSVNETKDKLNTEFNTNNALLQGKNLFEINYDNILDDKKEDSNADKYKKSGLTKEKSEKYYSLLLDLIENTKPYQDSELTLFTLAKQLYIHPNHLSQIINQFEGKNFFDFINEKRVSDVKKALKNGEFKELSLLGLAHKVGFNSKASFNRAFKKFTGMTPTEYKKSL